MLILLCTSISTVLVEGLFDYLITYQEFVLHPPENHNLHTADHQWRSMEAQVPDQVREVILPPRSLRGVRRYWRPAVEQKFEPHNHAS